MKSKIIIISEKNPLLKVHVSSLKKEKLDSLFNFWIRLKMGK